MKTKFMIKVLCCTLCIVTLALQLPLDIVESKAASQSDVSDIEKKISELEDKIDEYEKKIDSLKDDNASALEEKTAYEEQIALIEAKITSTEELIAEYDRLIEENEASSKTKQGEYDEMFEKVKERLRIRYEGGRSNQLVYIMESSSFTDFLVNMERTADILKYDRQLMEGLKEQKESLDADHAVLEQYRSEQEEARESLEAEKEDLETKKSELNEYIDALNDDQERYEDMLLEAEEANEALNEQLEELLAELAKDETVQHPVDKSALMWPVSTDNNIISSYYGERTLWGRKGFHYGIDIPAPAGNNVYAAQSGTVVISQWHYSYGNYVVINHGGGYTTLYAHNTSNNVTEGQVVNRGDIIAFVGTTGSSSGNHCHFEVRYNGAHQNPLNYVTQP